MLIARAKQFIADRLASYERRVTRIPISRFLKVGNIDCILDVGANAGQFAKEVRSSGYRGKIVSFEPLPDAFAALKNTASHDASWTAHNYALGREQKTAQFNVSANSASSSFLPLDKRVDIGLVDLSTVNSIDVEVKPLDSVFSQVVGDSKNIYLKIDTQGFEREVIEGARKSLPQVEFVQMELGLIPHYVGETPIEEMIAIMREINFEPWWILDGYLNPKTFQLFQVDVFFRRIH